MALYKLSKNSNQTEVTVRKNGEILDLKRDVYDTGVEHDGWGGAAGEPDQICFALTYDVLGNDKSQAVKKYELTKKLISFAAPFEIELSTDVIANILNGSDVDNGEDDNIGVVHE